MLDLAGSATGSAKERQYGEKLFSFAVVGGMVQNRIQQVRIGEDTGSTARLKWVGEEWLKKNSGRKAEGKGQHQTFSEKPDTELSMAYQNCQAPGYCGRSVEFGAKSNLKLVITEAECENGGCYLGCHVRDARGRMAQPPKLAAFGAEKGIPRAPVGTTVLRLTAFTFPPERTCVPSKGALRSANLLQEMCWGG